MTPLKKASVVIIIAIIAVLAYLIFAIFDVEEDLYKEQKQSMSLPVAAKTTV